MKSRVTPSSLPTREIRSSWIRIAIFMGVRTRSASASFVFGAAADTDVLKIVRAKNDRVRTANIFLSENIFLPPKAQNTFLTGKPFFVSFKMLLRAIRLAKGAPTSLSAVRGHPARIWPLVTYAIGKRRSGRRAAARRKAYSVWRQSSD